MALRNWAKNIVYSTRNLVKPGSLEEVVAAVVGHEHVKTQGTGHSFTDVADTFATDHSALVSLCANMNKVLDVDLERMTATVEGGITYGDLCPVLEERGVALENLASLPHISVAGAVATATHGSGVNCTNLSDAVLGMEFVDGTGAVQTLDVGGVGGCPPGVRNPANGAVVSYGALGVTTKLKLRVVPTFRCRQAVYEGVSLADLRDNFHAIAGRGYSVSMFTTWRNEGADQGVDFSVWSKRKVDLGAAECALEAASVDAAQDEADGRIMGRIGALCEHKMHPIAVADPVHCTVQREDDAWFNVLPHFKFGFVPSFGDELQTEYFVPLRHAGAALDAVAAQAPGFSELVQTSEIRTVARDGRLWMSPAQGEAVMAVHFTWVPDTQKVTAALPALEAALVPFGARAHCGKVFSHDFFQAVLPNEREFWRLVEQHDPEGKFRNDWVDRNQRAV